MCVCLYSVQHCLISAMKLIRSSSAPLSAELCGMPALFPSSLFPSLRSACCAVARRPSPSLLFLFLFLISFLLCKFLHAASSLCLTSLPSSSFPSLPHSLPSLFPSPLCLATPGSRCAPQGTLFMQEASFAYCACFFFHISTRIFFRVFRMCVFPSRAT